MAAPITFILGCTGSGKGSLGRALAQKTGGEIVSLDSMKVYRRMNIGTAKPTVEHHKQVRHHLIDIVEPWEEFSVAQFVDRADSAIAQITSRRRPVFVVGGTPLYAKALTQGIFEGPSADPLIRGRLLMQADTQGRESLYARLLSVDPISANRIHPNDLRRIVRALEVFESAGVPISSLQKQWDQQVLRYDCFILCVRRDSQDQNRRTNERVRNMMADGLVEEVKSLMAEPKPLGATARQAVGYAEVIEFLTGRSSLAEATELIKIHTRRLAKAQRTWFKRFSIQDWIDVSADSDGSTVADELLQRYGRIWSS